MILLYPMTLLARNMMDSKEEDIFYLNEKSDICQEQTIQIGAKMVFFHINYMQSLVL